jgi:hypothetical protein
MIRLILGADIADGDTESSGKERSMSFALYTIGFAIMLGGLIWGANLMHIPAHWIFLHLPA